MVRSKGQNKGQQSITPGSIWKMTRSDYLQGRYIEEDTQIEIESIQINIEDAFVFFVVKSYRMIVDAVEFRKKFGFVRYTKGKEQFNEFE